MYLEIKDMKKSFGSGESYNQVLKGITTNIEQGQMCVIQGSSGSGKSTILKSITRQLQIIGGKVYFDDLNDVKLHRWIGHHGFRFS